MLLPSRNSVNKLPYSFLPISYVLSLGRKDGNKLFYDGKKIARLKEESIIVDKATKSARIKKLRLKTAESVAGLSEKWISRITGKNLSYKVHNARFRNHNIKWIL